MSTAVAVLVEATVRMAEHPQLQAMYATNDADRFIEGCHQPWFGNLFARTLADIRMEGVSDRVIAATCPTSQPEGNPDE